MTDIREQIDRIKARAEEVTPGPWTHGQAAWGLASNGPDHIAVRDSEGNEMASLGLGPDEARDAEFIAHSRSDIDRLTEALEAVLNELDRCDDGIKVEYVYRGRQARTPDDRAVERIQTVKSAEREAARRIRAAITNALTEEDA